MPIGKKIAVVDYGMGNIWSVRNALAEIGASSLVASKPQELKQASKIILPGVGAFEDAMKLLRDSGLQEALNDRVTGGIPVLGVCLGMQLMCKSSEEGGQHEGLGWVDAKVKPMPQKQGLKIPHMGWNSVEINRDHKLVEDVQSGTDFYFVHSYHVECGDSKDVLATACHGIEFTSMFARGNLFASQFHPEKSQLGGLCILRNFVEKIEC
jgi:imidazole glycerol-phosphate synthase subunit HisH